MGGKENKMNIKVIKELADKIDKLESYCIENGQDKVKLSKKFLETKNYIMDVIVKYDKEVMGL